LEEKEWLERTDFPIGLDVDGQFFPLEPEFDIFGQSDVVERFITLFKWTDDDLELNLFPVLKPEDEKPEGGTGNTHPAYGPVLKVFASVELDADPPNYGKAFEYYRIAAEKGRDPEAQYNLGILYANGQGTEKNLLLAAYWLRQAGEANFHDAQATESQVTFMYLDENIRTRTAREVFQAAIDYYRTLFGMENAVVEANALIDAISKYYVKEDENKDYVCALKCFRAMAEFGDSDSAMYNVGLCHLHGWGTPEEHPAALYWFDRAADCGNEQAGERRDGLIDVYRRGSGNAGAKNLLELLALWCRTGMPEVMHDERKSKYWEAKAKELICDGKRK
jgi:TPR repeat protein